MTKEIILLVLSISNLVFLTVLIGLATTGTFFLPLIGLYFTGNWWLLLLFTVSWIPAVGVFIVGFFIFLFAVGFWDSLL